jgi:phage terminase large subunit
MTPIKLSECIAPVYYDMHKDVRRMGHSEYWCKGGRASAKSSVISIEIVQGIVADPYANAIVYRRVGNTLKDSVYSQIIWAIDKLDIGKYFQFRLSPLEIVYTGNSINGERVRQRILFRGADDPMKSKSIRLTHGYFKYLWFEELAEFRGMDDVRTIKQSVFRGVERAITFYSYNPPKSAQNWVNAEAMTQREDRMVHHSTYLDIPKEWVQTAFLNEAEAVKAANERAYKNEYLGEVTGTGGQVFDNLEVRTITADEIEDMEYFYYGLDFGFATDPDACIECSYSRAKRTLWILNESYAAGNSIDALSQKIKAMRPRGTIRSDRDPRMINELKSRGIAVEGVKKGPGTVEHGLRWLQGLAKIVIDARRTPNAAREFAAYEYEQDRNGNFRADYPDRDNHAIDATRYALEPIIGKKTIKTIGKGSIGL